jgi:hypothetical protein
MQKEHKALIDYFSTAKCHVKICKYNTKTGHFVSIWEVPSSNLNLVLSTLTNLCPVFVIYFMMLSLSQTIHQKMVRLLVNNELERVWKETVVAFAWKEWEKTQKTSVKIASVLAEIQTKHLLNQKEQGSMQLATCFCCFFLGLLSDPEDGNDMFLRNVGLSPQCYNPEECTVHK